MHNTALATWRPNGKQTRADSAYARKNDSSARARHDAAGAGEAARRRRRAPPALAVNINAETPRALATILSHDDAIEPRPQTRPQLFISCGDDKLMTARRSNSNSGTIASTLNNVRLSQFCGRVTGFFGSYLPFFASPFAVALPQCRNSRATHRHPAEEKITLTLQRRVPRTTYLNHQQFRDDSFDRRCPADDSPASPLDAAGMAGRRHWCLHWMPATHHHLPITAPPHPRPPPPPAARRLCRPWLTLGLL